MGQTVGLRDELGLEMEAKPMLAHIATTIPGLDEGGRETLQARVPGSMEGTSVKESEKEHQGNGKQIRHPGGLPMNVLEGGNMVRSGKCV